MELTLNRPSTAEFKISRVDEGKVRIIRSDLLAVEEPLEIQIRFGPDENRVKKNISITMRTPGNDFDLAAGFLFTEGIIRNPSDLLAIEFCGPTRNVVRAELNPETKFDMKRLERHFYTSSSCGVCGKPSIEALRVLENPPFEDDNLSVSPKFIHELPRKLREGQGIFDATGGLHASAIFDETENLKILREDVGRHNALDKIIGHAFLNKELPLSRHILLVSGRASFELVQKAAMAGIIFFAAVGAPSSLAVELAKETNMTLLGFVRNQRFNIYSGESRVKS
jgi:FdhD protein